MCAGLLLVADEDADVEAGIDGAPAFVALVRYKNLAQL